MSGGSYNYAYRRIEDLATDIREATSDPLRLAFADHLDRCAEAAMAIEWVDSRDWARGRETESIKAVVSPAAVLSIAIGQAEAAQQKLEDALAMARNVGEKQ